MQQRIMNVFGQLLGRWQALGRAKQIRFSVAAVILLLAIAAAVFMFTRPQLVVIEANMSPDDLSQAMQLLQDNGIKAQTANNTTALSVPKGSVDSARLLLGANGFATKDEITYSDAMNLPIGATERTRNLAEVQAKQNELAVSIMMLKNIKFADVTLSIPDVTPFILRDQDMSTATVVLDTVGDFTAAQAEAIAYHISKGVKNLKPENVSIMDTNGRSLYQTGPEGIAGSVSRQQEVQAAKKFEVEDQVRSLLSPQYDLVDVVANIDWDWTETSRTETKYSPYNTESGSGIPGWESISESTYENTEPGAEPGAAANNGQTTTYPTGQNGNSTASQSSSERDFLVDTETSVTESPATGRWIPESSSISVIVYVNRLYREDDVRANGLLDNTTWEDFKTDQLKALVPLDLSNGQAVNVIRGATGIQEIIVDGYEKPVFEDTVRVVMPLNQYLMAGLLLLLIALLAFGLIRRTQPVEITEIEPELSVEELLVSSEAQETKTEETLPEIDYFAESELKKQIDKFVDEKPEAAAQLLRNWLSEEWE